MAPGFREDMMGTLQTKRLAQLETAIKNTTDKDTIAMLKEKAKRLQATMKPVAPKKKPATKKKATQGKAPA